jgi:hypothetical protein
MVWGGGAVDYAADVHQARPWTKVAIAQTDLAREFKKNWGQSSSAQDAFRQTVGTLGLECDRAMDDYVWGPGRRFKRVRRGRRTWETITDSGALKRSRRIR